MLLDIIAHIKEFNEFLIYDCVIAQHAVSRISR